MDREDEDVLMTDLGVESTRAAATRTSPGMGDQIRATNMTDGNLGRDHAPLPNNSRTAKLPETQGVGQQPRSTSVLANDVAGYLNISSASSEDDYDELADDSSESKSAVRSDPLPYSKLLTGLCYDTRMRYHCELEPLPDEEGYIAGGDPDFHPEDPRRIWSIYRELCVAGLVEDKMSVYGLVKAPMARIEARPASPAEICLVHTRTHYNFVESLQG